MSTPNNPFKPNLDDNSPLYLQVARKLIKDVRDGYYQPDQALPSERTLSEQMDISRVTARKAIDRLVDQGLVTRRGGSGNYVAPRIEQPLSNLSSFSEQLKNRGYQPGSHWLRREVGIADTEEQVSLGLSANSRVARLERLRLAGDVVMAYEVSVIPATVLPRPEGLSGSLYAHLEKTSHMPVRALQYIRAVNAPSQLAGQLGVPEGHALLHLTRVGYLPTGQAVELTHSYCRSDHYDFVAEMRRPA